MGSRVKEDEKIERAIRGLLKLPENRRCINCNSLGPQYVCTTFWTFVCTNCSGIHREFTHRVKSVSMAKFMAEEVSALQAGGNERARQIYFKEWDPQRNPYPDGSNLYRLRNFIKSVYVDKRYNGESSDKISRLGPADTDNSSESQRVGTYSVGSRSPNNGKKSERSSCERTSAVRKNGDGSFRFYFDEKRSPRHTRQSSRSRGLQRSPIRFEIVDDRFRDDGGVKRYDGCNSRESRGCSKSLDLSNNRDSSNSPVVRSVKELLGDNAPHLQVGNVVKVEERKDANDGPSQNRAATSSDKKTAKQKRENPESIIDFLTDSEPSDPTLAPGNKQMPPSDNSNSQSSSELPASQKTTQDPDANSLEALLFGLSVPSLGTGTKNFEVCSKNDISSAASTGKNPAASLENQISKTPDKVDSFAATPTNVPAQSYNAGPLGSVFPAAADSFNTEETTASGAAANNQASVVSAAPNLEGQSGNESTLDILKPAQGTLPGILSEPHQEETKSSGRRELPEVLFTGGFSFSSPQVHGWQSGLPHGMGFGVPYYHNALTMGTFPYTAKPTNPFDLSSETDPVQASQFPSIASMQGALPHVSAPRGFSDCSRSAGNSPGLMASQSPFYAAAMALRSPSFISTLSPGAYMAQQTHMNMLLSPRTQGVDGLSVEGNGFNPENAFHQGSSGCTSAANSNFSNSRGNPFG